MPSGALGSLWVRLSRPPAHLAIERRRSFQIFIQTYLFASVAHGAFIPVFMWIGIPLLSLLNLACIVVNLAAVVLHRRGFFSVALLVKIGTLITLIALSGMLLGRDTGFEYYFFVILFEVLISDLSRRHKLLLSTLLLSMVLGAVNLLYGSLGSWPFGTLAQEILHSLNLACTFVLFIFIILQVHFITETTERRFRTDATHDSLTGVLNRRAIFASANQLWQHGEPMALLLLDADYFKQINDNHGHSAGDEVLRHLAQLLRHTLREGDAIGRVGGEEFLVLLPHTSFDEALLVALRLRERLARQPCRLEALTLPVTLSMGLALSSEGARLREVIDLADRRLYLAKSSGRDQLVAEGGESPAEAAGDGVTARLLADSPASDSNEIGQTY
nr:GGDEF domain-containing protein [uncultured Halomonas sp.]